MSDIVLIGPPGKVFKVVARYLLRFVAGSFGKRTANYSSSLLEQVDKGPRQTIDRQCNCNSLAQTNVWILSIHP